MDTRNQGIKSGSGYLTTENEANAYKKGRDGHIQAVASKAICNHIQPVDESGIRYSHNKC